MGSSGALDGLVQTPRAGEQLALLADGQGQALGGREAAVSGGNGKPGRPAGSRNKANKEIRAWLMSRYADPLEGAVAWALPADMLEAVRRAIALAKMLKCEPLEALEFQRRMTEAALPYLHARAVELKGEMRHVAVHVGLGLPPAPGADTAQGIAQLRQMLEDARDLEGVTIDAVVDDIENAGGSSG